MKNFEYFTYTIDASSNLLKFDFDFNAISDKINRLGAEGWELVCVVPFTLTGNTLKLIYSFKREIF